MGKNTGNGIRYSGAELDALLGGTPKKVFIKGKRLEKYYKDFYAQKAVEALQEKKNNNK